jgi:hypothetical protein
LPFGSTPTVTNSGTSSAAVFNFGIPAGKDGTNGLDANGVFQPGTKFVTGYVVMGNNSAQTVNLVTGAQFTSGNSYVCTGMVRVLAGSSSANTTLSIIQTSGTQFTINANKDTVVNYMCIGN